MATQTESPRAALTKTVEIEVQVTLEKKVSVATQTVQLDDGWVSEPETEQPMNKQASVSNILARLCILSNAYSNPKSPPPPWSSGRRAASVIWNGKQKEEEREETERQRR